MTRPTKRPGSAVAQFRRKLPKALSGTGKGTPFAVQFPAMRSDPAHHVRATLGRTHVTFSLRTRDPEVAKARTSVAAAHLAVLLDRLRTQTPTTLTQREAVAYSKQVYDTLITAWSADPKTPEQWAAVKGLNRAVREGRLAAPPSALTVNGIPHDARVAHELFGDDLTTGINAKPSSKTPSQKALEARFGKLADDVLRHHGITNLDVDGRAKLLIETERTATQAAALLKRNARGDYRPDPDADRFPAVPDTARSTGGPTWAAVINAWSARHEQGDGAAKTRQQTEKFIGDFARLVGAARPLDLRPQHIRDHISARLAAGLNPRTVANKDHAMLQAVINAAIGAGVYPDGYVNPVLSVQAPRQSAITRARDRMRSHSDADVAAILAAAERETDPLMRWVPLLCVTTGGRVATMVNLRGCDIQLIDGIWCAYIDPEAGPVKSAPSIRHVPLHPDVLAAGFLDFVDTKGTARLFYDDTARRRMRRVKKRTKAGSRPPAASLGDSAYKRLCAWVKTVPGIEVGMSKRTAPLHGLRKWASSALVRGRVDPTVARFVTGHAAPDAAGAYPDQRLLIAAMYEAVCKIELPSIIERSAEQPLYPSIHPSV